MARLALWKRQKKVTLADVHESLTALIANQEMITRDFLEARLANIQGMVNEIRPAHVSLSEELAAAILDKMRGPLAISQATSDWLKSVNDGRPFIWTTPLGYSPTSGIIRAQITALGTIILEMENHEGETFWRGEFAPPHDAE